MDTIEQRYKKDETDEFLKPIVLGEDGRIKGTHARLILLMSVANALKDHDTLFFFNYRSDRMREIVSLFGLPDKPIEVSIPEDLVRFDVLMLSRG